MFMHAMGQVARKEFIQHFRTKRLFVVGTLLALIMALATIVGPGLWANEAEQWSDSPEQWKEESKDFQPNMVLLFYLGLPLLGGYMFIQLLAIILTSDSICSEWQNRTIFLLLSKPVPRSAFLLGKFLGTSGALAVVIVAIASVDYLIMNLVLPDGQAGDVWGFLGAVGILVLGAAAFSSFALFASTLTRSTIMSTLMGLAAWMFVFPILGSAGFLIAIADEDFRNEGELDWRAMRAECGDDPRWYHDNNEPTAAEMAAYDACTAKYEQEVIDYYAARGLAYVDYEARQQVCQAMNEEEFEWYNANSQNMTDEEHAEWWDKPRASTDCFHQLNDDYKEYNEGRDRIRLARYDSPRVDWSRYLSPSSTMSLADDLLRGNRTQEPYEEVALSPETMFAGADSTPAHPVLGVFALVGVTAVFLGAGILVIRRRNFE